MYTSRVWVRVRVRVWVTITVRVWGTVRVWITVTVSVWVTATITLRVRVRIRLSGMLSSGILSYGIFFGYRFNNDIYVIQFTPRKSADNH